MKKHLVSTVNAICSSLPKKRSRKKVSHRPAGQFFSLPHNTIKENLKQLGNGMPDMEKKERVRIKGFAAYKDNSTELKGE